MAAVEAAPSETDGVDPIRVTCLPARDPWNGSDPLEGRGQRVKTRRAPRPNQALGLGGRSHPGRCCPVRGRRPGRAVHNCKQPQGIANHDRVNRDRGHVCIDP